MQIFQGINLIFHSVRPGGGMERYVLDLISGISRARIPLRVVCQRLAWPGDMPEGVEFVVSNLHTPFARINTWWFERRALRLCHANWPVMAISRIPLADVAIVGGTHLGHLKDRGRTFLGWFNRLTVARERRMYQAAQTIVAHSGRVAGEIVQLYQIAPHKVRTLYPPVDVTHFSLAAREVRAAVRQELGVADDEFMLLFPSNNHVLKGADLILQALEGWEPRIRLVVVGKAPLVAPGVLNLGYRTDMPQLYAAADAVILASKYEAFGLVGPESILCGTPVLFATGVGAAEVLSAHACLRFERTVASLRAAVREALNRRAAGTLMVTNPPAHIHYPYSVEQHLAALLETLPAHP